MQAQIQSLSTSAEQEVRPSLAQPSLAVFLEQFFQRLNERGIKWCVLRNFDTLPIENIADDIDILVDRTQFVHVLHLLAEIPNVVVTSVVFHLDEVSVFIGGLACGGLHLDFTFEFGWKGRLFFNAAELLRRAHPNPKWRVMRVPDELDGTITAVLNTFLASGNIRERYRAAASDALDKHLPEAIERLSPFIDRKVALDLLALVAAGDYERTRLLLSRVRRALVVRELRNRPLFSVLQTARYYGHELQNCFSGRKCIRIATFGADGVGKTTVLVQLERRLSGTAGIVRRVNFRPRIVYGRPASTATGGLSNGSRIDWLLSFVRPIIWCLDYWVYELEHFRASSQLLIFDRYFHDVVVDPSKYHCSPWLGRLMTCFVATPDLWLILHAPAHVVCSRKLSRDIRVGDIEDYRKMTQETTVRYYSACDKFLRGRSNVTVLDATQPADVLLTYAEAAALALMNRRAASSWQS